MPSQLDYAASTLVRTQNLDLDVSLEIRRILGVLESAIVKLEMAVCVPMLLADNCKILRPHLPSSDIDLFMSIYTKYSAMPINRGPTLKADGSPNVIDTRALFHRNGSVSRMMRILCTKPLLRKLINHPTMSPGAANLLDHVRRLRYSIFSRLSQPPDEELAIDNELRSAYARNERAKATIGTLSQQVAEQRLAAEAIVTEQNLNVHTAKVVIAKILGDCKNDIKNIVADSERAMVLHAKTEEVMQDALARDLIDTQETLAHLLNEHLQQERELRSKRTKAEAQLAAWVDKYDVDVAAKHAEMEHVTAEYEEEKTRSESLQEEFDVQDEEYVSLMAEKQEVYERERDDKLYIIIINRSARRIQRYWRAYRARKLARKQAKKKARTKVEAAGAKGGKPKKGTKKKKK